MSSSRGSTAISIIALVTSIAALCLGGAVAANDLVNSAEIQNGSVKSIDLAKNSVRAPDVKAGAIRTSELATGAVTTSDIGEGEVTPSDVTMPRPVELKKADSASLQPPTTEYSLVGALGTYTKQVTDSVLEVNWTGTVEGRNNGTASGCIFQLRVDGQPSPGGGGEVYGLRVLSVSVTALFSGFGTGEHRIEIWARGVQPEEQLGIETGDRCVVGPAETGIGQAVVVSEKVI